MVDEWSAKSGEMVSGRRR